MFVLENEKQRVGLFGNSTMANVAKGVLTNGLGGNHTNMICGFFHLGPIQVIIGSPPIVPPTPEPELPNRGGGGSSMRPFWPDQTEKWDIDHPRSITIRITHKKKVTEKTYYVTAKRAKFVIKVLNFVSKTRELISIKVSNVKNKFASIMVKFKGNKD